MPSFLSSTHASAPPAPIGVGIVGLSANGGWAGTAHVPALAALPDAYELRALSASSAESAKAAGQRFGVPLAFGSTEELVERDEVNVVVVTVKVPHHRELVTSALSAGKTVLSEWPLGNGTAEAEEMAAFAASRKLRGFVGLQARSAPPVRYLRDLVADGYVGEVLSTSVVASGGKWGATYDSRSVYIWDRANGATMLSIPFGHTIDGLASVLGEFAELSATTATRRTEVRHEETGEPLPTNVDDQIAVTGTLESGAVASVHYRGGLARSTNFLWEINGTEGDLLITGDSGHLQFGQVTIHGARGRDAELAELPVPGRYDANVPALAGQRHTMAYTVAHAYAQLHADLTEGTHTVPDFAHAVRHHRLLDQVQQAATTGGRQRVSG
ncbi:Gfo/Idh/MocA family protein [Streptomyces sp. RTd22]|uniref:Gfo/Idh/MocA family protein n=1 Tax=Streptomyces sp. RTd22 TaxID=1841249 RepID=UPI0007C48407|nr:Gfo/Idh/MocA family oxidoreductase [Streptomyces sp. RTd22]